MIRKGGGEYMKRAKKAITIIIIFLVLASSFIFQPNLGIEAKILNTNGNKSLDKNNGDWSAPKVTLWNTDEADLMVRVGDIDNFGMSWGGIDPFSGKETEVHRYPYSPEADDPDGTDRIMVVSGYKGHIIYQDYIKRFGASLWWRGDLQWQLQNELANKTTRDGYTETTFANLQFDTQVRPVTIQYDLKGLEVKNAYIQMFVDDIQPEKWDRLPNGKIVGNHGRGGFSQLSYNQYQVTMSYDIGEGKDKKTVSERFSSFETVINNLDQHGPIGKLITLAVPEDKLDFIRYGGSGLRIKIDDPDHDTGDGYAIDFVRLLINKKDEFTVNNGRVKGGVYEAKYVGDKLVIDKSKPIIGAKVSISGVKDPIITDSKGQYYSDKVPAGQVIVTAEKDGYATRSATIETLIAGKEVNQDIGLVNLSSPNTPVISVSTEEPTNIDVEVTITYAEGHVERVYRIDGGEWKEYTGPFKVSENCKIEAKSKEKRKVEDDKTVELESGIAEKKITNIDKDPPTGKVIVDYSDPSKPVLKLILDEEDSEIIAPGSTVEYDNNTYNVIGSNIYLAGVKVATISEDGKAVTCYLKFGYTFRFKDKAGNIGTAYGESNLQWNVPLKDR